MQARLPTLPSLATRVVAGLVALSLSGAVRLVPSDEGRPAHRCACRARTRGAHGGHVDCACPICFALAAERARGEGASPAPGPAERRALKGLSLLFSCGTDEAGRPRPPAVDAFVVPRPPALALACWSLTLDAVAPTHVAPALDVDAPPPRAA